MPLIVLQRHDHGPRVWLAGRRCHHGLTGILLTLGGLAAMWHDRRDWREWLPR